VKDFPKPLTLKLEVNFMNVEALEAVKQARDFLVEFIEQKNAKKGGLDAACRIRALGTFRKKYSGTVQDVELLIVREKPWFEMCLSTKDDSSIQEHHEGPW